jgi:siroheme synthase-like protein
MFAILEASGTAMTAPFPIFLNLAGRACAVIGSGELAEEKVRTLEAAGARVRRYTGEEAQFAGVFLGISALNDATANAALREAAHRQGALFNALDDPPNCDFFLPAVHRQGDLVIALSTNGQCPALAVRLKEKLAAWAGPEYAAFLRIAREIRPRIRASALPFSERRALWYRLVDSPALEALKQGREAEARAAFEGLLKETLEAAEAAR